MPENNTGRAAIKGMMLILRVPQNPSQAMIKMQQPLSPRNMILCIQTVTLILSSQMTFKYKTFQIKSHALMTSRRTKTSIRSKTSLQTHHMKLSAKIEGSHRIAIPTIRISRKISKV